MSPSQWVAALTVFFFFPALVSAADESKKEKMELEIYKQSVEDFRHYSNLRFTALTVFIAVSSALLTVHLKHDYTRPEYEVRILGRTVAILKVIGIVLAIVFFIGQIRISWDLKDSEFTADKMAKNFGSTWLTHGEFLYWFWWTVIIILVGIIHVGAGFLWWFVPNTPGPQKGTSAGG